jgi:hypothetical protein
MREQHCYFAEKVRPISKQTGHVVVQLMVPGGTNPLHNHGSTTRQDEERTPPAAAAEGSVARPELRTAAWGANPLH